MTAGDQTLQTPWVKLRSVRRHPFIFRKMIDEVSPDASPGQIVAVYDRAGVRVGSGLYNKRSQIVLRMLSWNDSAIDEGFWRGLLAGAVSLRRELLRLDECTNAYRVVHGEGDGLSGLVVDRFADALSVEIFSLGMYRYLDIVLPILHELCGTRRHRVHVDDRAGEAEGLSEADYQSADLPRTVNITENGVRYRVDFSSGHKTGFFCDQRENRRRLAELAGGAEVLDVCCYTGGFGIAAKTRGQAAEVTCVDLDEQAIALARTNANLNNARISFVHADAFGYMRQMQSNGRSYDVVVLDPPKLVFGRNEQAEGRRKYIDLNRLALSLVKPDGLLLSCSCSGALPWHDFTGLIGAAAKQVDRQIQFIDRTGAAPDHPVRFDCPESEYLKAAWMRVL